MFKFRRPSICSSKEIFPSEESAGPPTITSVTSMTSPRESTSTITLILPKPTQKGGELSSGDQSSSSSSSKEKESAHPNSVEERSSGTMITKWSFNGEKLKANFKKSFIGQVMCDRKRKERHESLSQGQEKKVIRSVSDDEGVNDEKGGKDIKRTLSHDNFKTTKGENHHMEDKKKSKEGKVTSNRVERDEERPLVLSDIPLSNVMTRRFEGSYEPEIEREIERSINYNPIPSSSSSSLSGSSLKGSVSGGRRLHHRRRHRSPRHHSSSSERKLRQEEERQNDEEERPISVLEIESEGDSGQSQGQSLQEEGGNSVPLVKIDDSPLQVSTRKSDFQLELSNDDKGNSKKTSEPISFLESISLPGGDDHVMLSPRGGFHLKEGMDLPPSPPMMQFHLDPLIGHHSLLGGENESTKILSLTRQVAEMKETLKLLEDEYETMNGYKPSHPDKLNNREMRKVLLQLAKAKKDLKELKEDPRGLEDENKLSVGIGGKSFTVNLVRGSVEFLKSLDDTVREIENSLEEKRQKGGRPNEPERMSINQLSEEKSVMQRQLLFLEKRHGRPNSKEEKEIVRSLYDRYRAVKKFSLRSSSVGGVAKEIINLDLVPIVEGETLEFPPEETSHTTSSSQLEVKEEINKCPPDEIQMELDNLQADNPQNNEQFNSMNLCELEKRQREVKEEKRKLRNYLRRFECEFQSTVGRPPLKEEKYSSREMENYYHKYKRSRATSRLLQVLITKKRFPHLLINLDKSED